MVSSTIPPTIERTAGLTSGLELPASPRTIADLKLDPGFLHGLVLKNLYLSGHSTADDIAERMALPLGPTLEILDALRHERLTEILGSDSQSLGGYRYSLTNSGLERAAATLEQNGYAGPTPVTLHEYVDMVRRQSVRELHITRDAIESSLSPLVLTQETLDLIGQAITSERAVLLYGESGNGKTTASECLRQALEGHILIPHAVEVARQAIQLFDPASHEVVPEPSADNKAVRPDVDRRWVRIRRPVVTAAGELAANHLELIRDEISKTYEAPIQMKANGGLLVIDDFGRQRLDAAYLLNRWIVPLEKGLDTLSLSNGARFEVPFDVIPLFLSNKNPVELADEAFLRRIRYKIEIPGPTRDLFEAILRQECERNSVAYDEAAINHLVEEYFIKPNREMRGCHPRDLVEAIADAANYRGTERVLTPETIANAAASYFID
ncbi:MAG: AAA family ATPase [Candidatus Zixiibacteriota bacterium]